MKALVFHGPSQRSWDSVDDPGIVDPTDAVVRIDASTICGSDLHILKGDVPETAPGTVLGHEVVGTVEEVGAGVTSVVPGDRVLVSCISACGRCRFCKEAHYGQCLGGGGWILGHTIDGLQAEYARLDRLPDLVADLEHRRHQPPPHPGSCRPEHKVRRHHRARFCTSLLEGNSRTRRAPG